MQFFFTLYSQTPYFLMVMYICFKIRIDLRHDDYWNMYLTKKYNVLIRNVIK